MVLSLLVNCWLRNANQRLCRVKSGRLIQVTTFDTFLNTCHTDSYLASSKYFFSRQVHAPSSSPASIFPAAIFHRHIRKNMLSSNLLLATLALLLPAMLSTPLPKTVEETCLHPPREDKLVKRTFGICVEQHCVIDLDTGKACLTPYCLLSGKEGENCHCIPLTD